MKKNLVVFLLLTLAGASGCTSKGNEEGVIPQQQLKALEKAKEVEGILKDQQDALNKQIDEAK